jgi:hypothetical protein
LIKIEKITIFCINLTRKIKTKKYMQNTIYTSFFDNIRNLSENEFFFVCIRGDHPEWYDGFVYKPLIPRKWWFEWDALSKSTTIQYYFADNFYREMYQQTNLSKITPEQVISELQKLANDRKIILICGEVPPEFCHRRIIDAWLSDAGFKVEELEYLIER